MRQEQEQSNGSNRSVSSNTSSSHLTRLRILGVCTKNDDILMNSHRHGSIPATATVMTRDNKTNQQNGLQQQQQQQQQQPHRVIAIPRSSSYGKMIQRYQERQERSRRKEEVERQVPTNHTFTTVSSELEEPPKFLSVRRSWSNIRSKSVVPSSNNSVGSGTSGSVSSKFSLAGILAAGIPLRDINNNNKKKKKKKKKKKATVKSSKIVANMQRTNSSSSASFLARQKERKRKRKKRALAKAARLQRRQMKLHGLSLSPSTASQVGKEVTLHSNGISKSNSLTQSPQEEFPILTVVDSFSNQPVPPMNTSSSMEKDTVAVATAAAPRQTDQVSMTQGRPPLHPKLKSQKSMATTTNKVFKAVMKKNPLSLSRRKSVEEMDKQEESPTSGIASFSNSPPDDTSRAISTEKESTTVVQPHSKPKKKHSQVVFTTTTDSLRSLELPSVTMRSNSRYHNNNSSCSNNNHPNNNMAEDFWSKIWNAITVDPSEEQQRMDPHQSSNNINVHLLSHKDVKAGGGWDDISSSDDDEWTVDDDDDDDSVDDDDDDDSDLDLDGMDDDESLSSDDDDEDDEDEEEEEYFLVMVDDSKKVGSTRRGVASSGEDTEEVYSGGNDDVMMSMKRMYLAEMKDLEKSMMGWFDSVFSTTVKADNDIDDDRELENSNTSHRVNDGKEERDSEEWNMGNSTTRAEF